MILLKNVSVEDQGEYVCRASNSRLYIENSVTLSIQGTTTTYKTFIYIIACIIKIVLLLFFQIAAPHFTIPLEHRHLDKDSDLVWTCEACMNKFHFIIHHIIFND